MRTQTRATSRGRTALAVMLVSLAGVSCASEQRACSTLGRSDGEVGLLVPTRALASETPTSVRQTRQGTRPERQRQFESTWTCRVRNRPSQSPLLSDRQPELTPPLVCLVHLLNFTSHLPSFSQPEHEALVRSLLPSRERGVVNGERRPSFDGFSRKGLLRGVERRKGREGVVGRWAGVGP